MCSQPSVGNEMIGNGEKLPSVKFVLLFLRLCLSCLEPPLPLVIPVSLVKPHPEALCECASAALPLASYVPAVPSLLFSHISGPFLDHRFLPVRSCQAVSPLVFGKRRGHLIIVSLQNFCF